MEDKNKPIMNNQIVVNIKKEVFKQYLQLLKDKAEEYGYKIIKTKSKATEKSPAHIILEILEDYKSPKKIVRLGSMLEEMKYKAAAESREKQFKKKEKELNTFPLRFPKSITNEFKEQYADDLKLHKVIGRQGNEVELLFDVTDCVNRTQLVNRVLAIADAVEDIKHNKRYGRNMSEIEQTAKYLQDNCSYIMKSSETLVDMTGQETIDTGYATLWDIDSSKSTTMQKIWNFVLGKKRGEYYYMGKVVVPEQKYIVKLHKSKAVKEEPMNFKMELLKRYVYGEQVYFGYGMEIVKKFEKDTIEKHNARVKRENPQPEPKTRRIGNRK